jgi:acyl-CoA synthetase (AMP-forming)/AMP-acid ligase II
MNLPDVAPDDVMLHAASLFHASGCFVLPYWLKGACSAVLARFEPAEFLDAIANWRATSIHLVPTMLAMLLAHPDIEKADMSSVGTILYGASPMPLPVIKRALEFGVRDSSSITGRRKPAVYHHARQERSRGTRTPASACGRPSVDCEIRLIDDKGDDVPPGEQGEIALRAPFAMKGYFNAPDLNAATFVKGGRLRTRDVGRLMKTAIFIWSIARRIYHHRRLQRVSPRSRRRVAGTSGGARMRGGRGSSREMG